MRMLYDMLCRTCEIEYEDVYEHREAVEAGKVLCQDCQEPLEIKLMPPARVGAREDKPVVLGNLGKSFTSEKELQNYSKQTGTIPVMTGSTEFKKMYTRQRDKCEAIAKKHGFTDSEDLRKTARARKVELAKKSLDTVR